VDELHFIENKRDTGAKILLTLPPEGVKPQSFSDSFWFFNAGSKLLQSASDGATGQTGTSSVSDCRVPTAQSRT